MAKSAMVVLAKGAEEMEVVIATDVLRRAGVQVTVAGLRGSEAVTCSRGVVITPDVSLEDARPPYDAIVLPGGYHAGNELVKVPLLGRLLQEQEQSGRLIGAICVAAKAFVQFGIAKSRNITSHPSLKAELLGAGCKYCEARVVRDGAFITSQAPGTSFEFALALVDYLKGPAKTAELVDEMLQQRNHYLTLRDRIRLSLKFASHAGEMLFDHDLSIDQFPKLLSVFCQGERDQEFRRVSYILCRNESTRLVDMKSNLSQLTGLTLSESTNKFGFFDLNGKRIKSVADFFGREKSTFLLTSLDRKDGAISRLQKLDGQPNSKLALSDNKLPPWICAEAKVTSTITQKRTKKARSNGDRSGRKPRETRPDKDAIEEGCVRKEKAEGRPQHNNDNNLTTAAVHKETIEEHNETNTAANEGENAAEISAAVRPQTRLESIRALQDKMIEGESILERLGKPTDGPRLENAAILFGGAVELEALSARQPIAEQQRETPLEHRERTDLTNTIRPQTVTLSRRRLPATNVEDES